MYRQVERIRMCFAMLVVTIPAPLGDPRTFFGIAAPATSTNRPATETPSSQSIEGGVHA